MSVLELLGKFELCYCYNVHWTKIAHFHSFLPFSFWTLAVCKNGRATDVDIHMIKKNVPPHSISQAGNDTH